MTREHTASEDDAPASAPDGAPPIGTAEKGRPPPRIVPAGYRQGLITAITVLLGFSLTFLRFWTFDAPGDWGLRSAASTAASVTATLLQLVALFRSLRLEDEEEHEYRKTVRWFMASVITLIAALLLAVIEASLADTP